ncbi:flagellar hook-basal body complex protein FliE [Nocardioides campestrisoli]|uniref:flagellar hook-basal body complex protein FliE n=1 Tax=Nocardioides campestrisoli TaxID=2736757 RepID=UPI0015E796B5|nr:flagellar hook-basal body complex protein FliE [Nocardioides campestrisoli]
MSISGIESVGFTPYVPPTVAPAGASSPTGGSSGASGVGGFGDLVLDGLDRLEGVQDRADKLAVQAATGDLAAMHDYTIAATEAAVTTQLTVAVRNKALEAFNEIMRMQV